MNQQTHDLTCAEADELVAAYLLDALDEEERCTFAGHIVECRLHDVDLAELRDVAARLPAIVSRVQPAAPLRDKLLSSFDAAVAASAPALEAPRRLSPRLPRSQLFAYGLAAALLLLSVGLSALLLSGGDEGVVQAVTAQNGMQMRVIYLEGQQLAVVEVQMPPLPAEQTYQAWRIDANGPESLGLLPNEGVTAFKTNLSGATSVAVSIEPRGGSRAPTRDPVLIAEF